ncbi:hypothetical protein [Microbacterium sp. 179-I 3D4 NHS]|uniref:hypothetical protein n=1 Tax=Microbacterium sp. 179-I 3D4 NHS TaxID=3142381 RepID=UPI00399FD9BA
MTFSEESVAQVVTAETVDALETMLSSAQSTLSSAMSTAEQHWLRVPEVFQVYGAEGAQYMLDASIRAAGEWGEALAAARTTLSEASMNSLPELERRRTELIARVVEVDRQVLDAADAVHRAQASYWAAYERDPESVSSTAAHRGKQRRTRLRNSRLTPKCCWLRISQLSAAT